MKAKIAVIAMYFLSNSCFTHGQSRCEKGTWIIGGNPISYSLYGKGVSSLYKDDSLIVKTTQTSKGVSIGYNLGAGYFLKNNFCIGTGFGNSVGYLSAPNISTYLFARYYLKQKKRCFSFSRQDNTKRYAFFLQGTLVGGYSKNENGEISTYPNSNAANVNIVSESVSSSYGGQVGIGFTYILTKRVAFEFMGIYSNNTSHVQKEQNNNGIALPVFNTIQTSNTLNLFFGIQTYF